MTSLLFLDVDGVLNFHGSSNEFADECVENLKSIVNRTKTQIVLSSTYKLDPGAFERLKTRLGSISFFNACPCTPDLLDSGLSRKHEIVAVLSQYKPVSWVVLDDGDLLDDISDSTYELLETHFVRTDPKKGISSEDVEKAVAILL